MNKLFCFLWMRVNIVQSAIICMYHNLYSIVHTLIYTIIWDMLWTKELTASFPPHLHFSQCNDFVIIPYFALTWLAPSPWPHTLLNSIIFHLFLFFFGLLIACSFRLFRLEGNYASIYFHRFSSFFICISHRRKMNTNFEAENIPVTFENEKCHGLSEDIMFHLILFSDVLFFFGFSVILVLLISSFLSSNSINLIFSLYDCAHNRPFVFSFIIIII